MGTKPILRYDAGCDFCRLWVKRWRERTGNAIVYEPATEPLLAVTLVLPTGESLVGAAAVCRLYKDVPGWRWLWWAHERLPGFAWIGQCFYRIVSHCRDCAYSITTAFIKDE